MNKEEKTITLGNELYEEFIEGKQTIDTHELLNLFAKRINNLQSKIDKAIEYCKYNDEDLYTFEPDYDYEENMVDNYEPSSFREDIMEILKEDK